MGLGTGRDKFKKKPHTATVRPPCVYVFTSSISHQKGVPPPHRESSLWPTIVRNGIREKGKPKTLYKLFFFRVRQSMVAISER